MIEIELQRKTATVFGLREVGKTTLVNQVARQFGSRVLVYDTLGEVPESANYYSYKPKDRNSPAELESVIIRIKDSGRFDLFVIDECNRFAPPKPSPLPIQLADLNDQCRHYGLSVIYIARRPVQLNQDLTELSDYIFLFALKGTNDIRYLNDLSGGLGDTVLKLSKHQFVVVKGDRSYFVANPVEVSPEWLKSADRHLTKSH